MWTVDNVNITRCMNSESVRLIYLDPPFSSSRKYAAPIGSAAGGAAFKDTWTLDDVDLAWHREMDEQHTAISVIIGAARSAQGKGMQSYLIMRGVRLLEMQRPLKPADSVLLHCDRKASHHSILLMDSTIGHCNSHNEV